MPALNYMKRSYSGYKIALMAIVREFWHLTETFLSFFESHVIHLLVQIKGAK